MASRVFREIEEIHGVINGLEIVVIQPGREAVRIAQRIEGPPVDCGVRGNLVRNGSSHELEERRRLQPRMGGRIHEPRPW